MTLTDELRIDTPEQVALQLPIAGIGSRFLAIFLDTLLQGISYLLAALVFALAGSRLARGFLSIPPALVSFLPAIVVIIGFCIYWGYYAFFEIIWKGQTPGKRLAGIRVIKETGRPVDPLSAILRNLLRGIDFLPVLYAVGITSMILTRHSRRLGDLVAGTVVVHDRPPARIDAEWTAANNAAGASSTAGSNVGRLTDDELVLIETYLQRRNELDWEARDRARSQIALRIAQRTGLRLEPNQSVDDFLEAVARQARDTARLR